MNNLNDFVNSISVKREEPKMTREDIITPDFDEHEDYLGCEVYYDEDDDWGTHTYSRRFNSWGEARGWVDKAKKHSNMYNFNIVEG